MKQFSSHANPFCDLRIHWVTCQPLQPTTWHHRCSARCAPNTAAAISQRYQHNTNVKHKPQPSQRLCSRPSTCLHYMFYLDNHVVTAPRGVMKWSATLDILDIDDVIHNISGRRRSGQQELSGRSAIVATRQMKWCHFVLALLRVDVWKYTGHILLKQHHRTTQPWNHIADAEELILQWRYVAFIYKERERERESGIMLALLTYGCYII